MKVSTRNIKIIKDRLEILNKRFNILPSSEDIRIGDETIFINFPDDESDYTYYNIDDFLRYTNDLENIKVIDNHSVVIGNIRQTIINVDEYDYDNIVPDIRYETEDFSLRIVYYPFLIGLIASRDGIYNDNYGISPCSYYTAVELVIKKNIHIDEGMCMNMIKQCLYYIAAQYNVPISIGGYMSLEDLPEIDYTTDESSIVVSESKLFSYCRAMDDYINGVSAASEDIKFLYFYKIIEFFSPIVSRKSAYEQLNMKLDALQITERDAEYLESFFNLAKRYDNSLKDKELAYTVLKECIDITQLIKFLPNSILKKLASNLHIKMDDISLLSIDTIDSIKKILGDVLYTTRSKIVHAKSNYTPKGSECPDHLMCELNVFMSKLCQCLIAWNSRQPKEFRSK